MVEPRRIVDFAKKYIGVPYKFGAEAKVGDPKPKALDCSELVQIVFNYFDIMLPDGSYNQAACGIVKGCCIKEALWTPAALVFGVNAKTGIVNHVAISDGVGGVIEATPSKVRHVKETKPSRWKKARLVKGVHYA